MKAVEDAYKENVGNTRSRRRTRTTRTLTIEMAVAPKVMEAMAQEEEMLCLIQGKIVEKPVSLNSFL